MKAPNTLWLALILLAGVSHLSCQELGSCDLSIVFPDEDARQMVKRLEIWVLPATQADCSSLVAGTVQPGDSGLVTSEHLRLDYPPSSNAQALEQVPVGEMIFYAEGLGEKEEIFLKGCSAAQVPATKSIDVLINMVWTCRPKQEACGNGIDDDCDGLTDEDCLVCEQDSDCDDDNPCTIDFCTNKECHHASFPQDTPCSDNKPCTLGDSCDGGGSCVGEQKDCSAFEGPCTSGTCDPQTGECGPKPKQDGTPCDDGKWCTTEDMCTSGECGGTDRDCGDDNTCTDDQCNEGEQLCAHVLVAVPGAEGPSGDVTCSNGKDDDCDGDTDKLDPNCLVCTANADCDDGNPCTEDICMGLECENRILEDGTSCTDGLYCTVNDACMAGACGGVARDCNALDEPCTEGICLEDEDRCEIRDMADGTWCEDGAWCTEGDQCQAGVCHGTVRNCDDGNDCTADACSEANNTCDHTFVPIPDAEGLDVVDTCGNEQDDDCDGLVDLDDPDCVECSADGDCDDANPCTEDTCSDGHCDNEPSDGADCDDGNYCTIGDICAEGQCTGTDRDCGDLDDECHEGVCSESESSCLAVENNDGSACDDGHFCTVSDHCTSGMCLGTARDCDDNDLCTLDECDAQSASCSHSLQANPDAEGPPGHGNCHNSLDDDCDGLTDLQDDDCFDCQQDEECDDNNPCTSDACTLGLCENTPLEDGTSCDDGLYCTVSDMCQSASCTGTPKDCSGASDACHEGSCDEDTDSCQSLQKPDGTMCDDGLWCTIDDTCVSGNCAGEIRTCSNLSDACHEGSCELDQDQCVAHEKPDNTQCDDGLWCTEDDRCQGGSCTGAAKSCNDSDDCTIDNCDEDNDRCLNVLNPNGSEGNPGQAPCANNLDDDCDGLTDLQDPDCSNCGMDADCDDSNPCTSDSCIMGLCHNDSAAMDGSNCDDGYWCTVADRCENGVCSGNLRDCDEYDEECGYGVCDLDVDSCVAQPLADGTDCDAGSWCSVDNTCTSGVCGGGVERDCSDSDQCTEDACDDQSDSCHHVFTEHPEVLDYCADNLDQDCDGMTDGCCLGDGSFSLVSTSSIEPGPWFMVAADISRDNIIDLVSVDRSNNKLSVLLGNGSSGRGDGSFQHHSYAVGQDPWGLATGDLDGDHNLDVVTANNGAGSVTVYWGQGDGLLGNRQDVSVGAGTQQVTIDDFNADKILDIATVNATDNNMAILLGQGTNGHGNRTFSPAVYYPMGASISPRSLVSGDFNADGIVDLAVAAFNGGSGKDVSIFEGNGADGKGDGTFALSHQYEAGSGLVNIAAADFNHDGILDLSVAAMNDNAVDVLLGQGSDGRGDGTFSSRTAYPTGANTWPVSCNPHDMNADGILDLVLAEWGTNKVSILWGNGHIGRGDGSFGAKTSYAVGTNPTAATAFDATGDDLPDLAACNYGSNDVRLLKARGSSGLGNGGFVIAGQIPLSSSPKALFVGDFNADAILDLVVSETDSSIHFFSGQGNDGRANATFAELWSGSTGSEPQWLSSADIDGDRISDLTVANAGDSQLGVLIADGTDAKGTGTFAEQVTYPAGAMPVAVETKDVNKDRIVDMIYICPNSLHVRLGNGSDGVPAGSFGSPSDNALSGVHAGLAIGDLNEDGAPDLVTANSSLNRIDVFLGDGMGGFSQTTSVSVGTKPVFVILADVDADGTLDVVAVNHDSSSVSIGLGAGDGTFAATSDHDVGAGPVMVSGADLNEDGLMDLLTANQAGASLSVLLGQGDGNFGQSIEISLGGEPVAVQSGYFDWDGKLDLAVAEISPNAIIILRGLGECSPAN